MENQEQEETKNVISNLIFFLKGIFSIKESIDKNITKERIKSSISFKGLSVYILIASVMVASIGLNANSAAVVIGAMLISPLMGPIVGLGYSVAVNDVITLRRSLVNFGIMVIISLFTSYFYFSLFPSSINEQLSSRIEPTLLDVMIAFFGGLAGIVASSSKDKNINAVAGVAIATALMPPLCTVGFCLAVGTEKIEVGFNSISGYKAALTSFYLFFINSVFISIVTFLFIRLVRFPLAKFQDSKKRLRTNSIILSIALLTMIPSTFIFYKVLQESNYRRKITQFLDKEVNAPKTSINKEFKSYEKEGDKKIIHISAIGETIPPQMIAQWNLELKKNYGVEDTEILVFQGSTNEFGANVVGELVDDYRMELYNKDSIITNLTKKVNKLSENEIPFEDISRELKAQYNDLDYFGYSVMNYTDFKKEKPIHTFTIGWKRSKKSAEIQIDNQRIMKYLKSRLKTTQLAYIKLKA